MNSVEPLKSMLSILKTAEALGLSFVRHGENLGRAILCCPFHDDKNPSFSLIESSPKNGEGFYHCFGCQASGDVFSLAQKMKGLSFVDAKRLVYSINGYEVPILNINDTDTDNNKENLIPLLHEQAHEVFKENSEITVLKNVMNSLGYKNYIPKELNSPEELSSFLKTKMAKQAMVDWKREAMSFYCFHSADTLVWYLDEPYLHRGTSWAKLTDNELTRLSIEFLEYRFGEKWVTKARNNEMLYFIRAYARIIFENNSFLFTPKCDDILFSILLQNKILTISADGEINLFDPKKEIYFSTVQWNVSLGHYHCDDNIVAPVFGSYLKRIQPKEENQILLMELMGYMLVPDNRLQKFFILQGEGKNGKSVFLSILKEMIGNGNYTSLSLDQLEKSYALASLMGRTANICADMGEIDKTAEGLLKSITSGDQITCDRKFLSAITYTPTAKHVFSTNNIPRFSDKSEGLWRRMIIIPFDETLSDEEVDVTITEKLKKEIDQIFLFALEGLKRIIKNGWKFSVPNEIKDVINEERDNASTLRQFVNENCTLSSSDSVDVKFFYNEYVLWTKENGQKPSSKNSIGRELARFEVKSKVVTYAGQSIRKYEGISIKEKSL